MSTDDFSGKVEKWYETKLGFLAIVFFPILAGTVAIVLYIAAIQTSIAVQAQEFNDFKNNDITHIELEITAINQSEKDQLSQIQNIQQQLAVTTEILNSMKK